MLILLIGFAFVAGIVTILSPCILPILPVVLSSSLTGGKRRPLGIVTGFVLSFTFFTVALASLVKAVGISPEILRGIAILVVTAFGVSLLFPQTQVLLERLFTKLSSFMPTSASSSPQEGFGSGVAVGLSLGLLWTPCVGPILATVITLAVANSISVAMVLITLAYAIGSGIPMLAIIYSGRQALQRVPWLVRHTALIQRGFGVIMVVVGVGLYFNLDLRFENWVVETFPQYGAGLTVLEDNSLVQQGLNQLRNGSNANSQLNSTQSAQTGIGISTQLLAPTQLAPDFTGGTHWLSSPPLSLKKELKGKVVLVDFWTYSCINCIRTFPYLRQWYQKYKDQGLVILGVHSPEFAFEKDTQNVQQAIQDFQLSYPVVQDNDFTIWNAYQNHYWPAHYLIDKNGYIRYTHFGEGQYVETENAIRQLLGETPLNTQDQLPQDRPLTPETYLGYSRADGYSSQNQISIDKAADYTVQTPLEDDAVALQGRWKVGQESITNLTDNSSIWLNFQASKVYLVLSRSTAQPIKAQVKLDGQPLPSKYYTADMDSQGNITIDQPRKYDIVDLKNEYGRHQVQIIFPAGVQAYAFTFGE